MVSKNKFTWVKTHNDIVIFLKDKKDKQIELINLLKNIGITEGLTDEDANGQKIELTEIDPFTFFCYLYKFGSGKRLKLLQNLAEKINSKPIPNDDSGIPSAYAQKVWLFPYKRDRNNDEINKLWDFFFLAQDGKIDDATFKSILGIKNIGKSKITEGLFNINPAKYLPINIQTKPYLLDKFGIESEFDSYTAYESILSEIRQKTDIPFYQISFEAWDWNIKSKNNYWIFQGNPSVFDFETALRNNLIEEWTVTAHKDKIDLGDKVIIWLTGSNSGCYALAEVTSKPMIIDKSIDDYLWKKENKNKLKSRIKITHNIIDNPILLKKIKGIKGLKDLNVGNQGTNFKATKEEYETILNLINNNMKYWIYAPGENASEWEDFYENGVMGLGWDNLGDLNKYNSKEEIVKKLQELHKSDGSKKNDSSACWDFKNSISIGDIIFAKKGISIILGYGIVTSDYYFDDNVNAFTHRRKIDWKTKGEWYTEHNRVKTLTDISEDKEFVNQLMKLFETTTINNNIKASKMTLNQILYGPPGTGKTYNTINRAIKIVNPDFDLNQDRKIIKEEFNRLVKDGQIVFTTFHQSMGYEDFIEGIKPIEPENEGEQVIYKIELGIFRKLCIEASFAIARLSEDKTTEDVLDFSALYDKLVEDIEEKLLTGKKTELKTKNGGSVLVENISQQRNITIKHHDGTRIYTVSKARLSKLNSEIKSLDDVNNINTEFKSIIGGSNSSAYWSVLNAIKKMKPITKIENVNYDFEGKKEVVESLTKLDYKNADKARFVLIIDEINRGNVSQIFGELITLIEDDKRLGKEEALEITLPYSKETFGVPPNLFIIGTMNTADRSVEALDTALRRRFSFEEMLPKYDLDETKYKIEGYAVNDILKTINNRIEKLLDKDHLIGHSYFMNIKTIEELEVVFKNKVIPLLQEYFYGDYGKIGLVLGNGFVRKIEWNGDNLFADFDYENKSDYDDREVFEIHCVDFKNALKLLMEKKQK